MHAFLPATESIEEVLALVLETKKPPGGGW